MVLVLNAETGSGKRTISASLNHLVVAGWTGRDARAAKAHIAELAKLGVRPPKALPTFYRVAAALLTTAPTIEIVGADSSGEVEPVLFSLPDGLWVGLGSDHTDRRLETIGVTISKQVCAKPVAPTIWRFDEIAAHWDQLVLRSYVVGAGTRRCYQEGSVSLIRGPRELLEAYFGQSAHLPAGAAMFCGTIAVHGAIEPAARFEVELEDPLLGRRISHGYDITVLPAEE